jgi:hypothetical protein
MTREFLTQTITTEAEFDAVLGEALLDAARNNVDTRGSWVHRNGPAAPDLEVTILELAKRDSTD